MTISEQRRLLAYCLTIISIVLLSAMHADAQDEPYVNSLSSGHVYDFDKVISNDTRLALERKMASFETSNGKRLIFITIVNHDNSDIPDSVFDAKVTGMLDLFWQCGNKNTKEVLLIAVSLSTGHLAAKLYSADKNRNDAMMAETNAITDKEMIPRFHEKKYSEGIAIAINEILKEWK